MRTNIPEKLLKIVDEIEKHGNAELTRLTVLKKWFEQPRRLSTCAIWAATQAASHKHKASGAEAKLFREARALLAGADTVRPRLNRQAASALHQRLQEFQNEHRNQRWGPVRIIHNWNLMLVEQGLDIYLSRFASSADGYKLAADYCQNFDSRHGNGLNGPSRTKIKELARFISAVEDSEDKSEWTHPVVNSL